MRPLGSYLTILAPHLTDPYRKMKARGKLAPSFYFFVEVFLELVSIKPRCALIINPQGLIL